jgi:hypothetical protein
MLHQATHRLITQGKRVIVVLSAGLQEFSRFAEHREKLLHNVRDDEPWPQPWIDSYINHTMQLFSLYSATAAGLGANPSGDTRPCIVWRAQNIAARHTNRSEPKHHPSAVNGPHHWLNRISMSLARQYGLRVLDLTDLTIPWKPSDHSTDGQGWMTARAVDAQEGDVYHGYTMGVIAPRFLSGLAEVCCGSS